MTTRIEDPLHGLAYLVFGAVMLVVGLLAGGWYHATNTRLETAEKRVAALEKRLDKVDQLMFGKIG